MTRTAKRPDWGRRFISALLVAVASWLLLLPFSAAVQQVSLRRQHLQTGSFLRWALQAPVPAMYNFHNRYWLTSQTWDIRPIGYPTTGTLNHFPVRLYTFGDHRGPMRAELDRHALTVTSSYRGQTLTTHWRLKGPAGGQVELAGEVVP